MNVTFLILLLLFAVSAAATHAQIGSPSRDSESCIRKVVSKSGDSCETFSFRWIELDNYMLSPSNRRIEIFLDPTAFSEANLRSMFEHLSRKTPSPQNLTINVRTSWNQLEPNSDCPAVVISGRPDPIDLYDYLSAFYWRRADREYFRYSPAVKVHESKWTQVIIRAPK